MIEPIRSPVPVSARQTLGTNSMDPDKGANVPPAFNQPHTEATRSSESDQAVNPELSSDIPPLGPNARSKEAQNHPEKTSPAATQTDLRRFFHPQRSSILQGAESFAESSKSASSLSTKDRLSQTVAREPRTSSSQVALGPVQDPPEADQKIPTPTSQTSDTFRTALLSLGDDIKSTACASLSLQKTLRSFLRLYPQAEPLLGRFFRLPRSPNTGSGSPSPSSSSSINPYLFAIMIIYSCLYATHNSNWSDESKKEKVEILQSCLERRGLFQVEELSKCVELNTSIRRICQWIRN
jgi:hypothetical protein